MIIHSSDVDHFYQEQQGMRFCLFLPAREVGFWAPYAIGQVFRSFVASPLPLPGAAQLLAIFTGWLLATAPFPLCLQWKKKYAAVPKLISSLPGSGHLPMLRSCPHMGLVSALAGWYSTKPGSGSAPWAAKQQHLRSLVPQRLLSAVRCAVCWPATGDWPQVIIHVICTLLETAQRESLKVQRMDHFRSQRTELVKGSCR